MARDTLLLLAEYQAYRHDAFQDAEPGKILHELRRGELAMTGDIPQSPAYYGTVDATMLFLILAANYLAWTGDLTTIRSLRPNIDRALVWMSDHGDHDHDGYFDYVGNYGNGLVNQGWKDSGNAIVNADGSLVTPPVALAEVQSYAFKAWRDTSQLLRELGDDDRCKALEHKAAMLREPFDGDFWSDDLGCYVLARQAGGRPARVVASNAGQVLWGGIADPAHARQVVDRLLRSDMFTGWGIRTLSSHEKRFNPVSYHLGSVWPHDNGLFLAGARRYGADDAACRVFEGLFDAAVHLPGFRLPELFCGYQRHGQQPPVPYPHASAPQAWAAAALPHGLWSLLGLRPDALRHRLVIVRPVLPRFLEWVELNGLRVADAVVNLRFERDHGETVPNANVVDGQLQVEFSQTFQ
jgi:glycogen debranching enzyme